ncbi:cyclin-like protein [Patellaria atrata CBS 101060]|uniref:Transcription initiation factor IIB n=1 Tax=Patellaria atrata CBS 101060 TaxID=1346257 RepID=A0A9P4VVL8_9PEZI|nr:cyclin-like protein [Patellaria atrata CBS 101060]
MTAVQNGRVLSPGEVITEVVAPVEQEWQENLNIHLICPDCRESPPDLVEEFASGDVVCASCGLVLSNRIVDTRSEWRTFSNDDQGGDDPSRVGDASDPFQHGSQLQTSIAFDGGNARGRELHRAQNKVTHDKSKAHLTAAYKQISSYCDAIHLAHIVSDTAKHIFMKADDSKAFRGKSQDALIGACLFIACRQNNVPRSFREIQQLTKVPKKELGRTFKTLEKFLTSQKDLSLQGGLVATETNYAPSENTRPSELCRRFCNQLGLSKSTSQMAENVADKMKDAGSLAGRSPLSIAASCIYMVSHLKGEPKTPKDIAAIAGVSDGTIRTAYKYLYAEKNNLLDPVWLKEKGADMSKLPPA